MAIKQKEGIGSYLFPEMKSYIYCFFVFWVSQKEIKESQWAYDRLVESFGLPGLEAIQEQVKNIVPNFTGLVKILNEESEVKIAQARIQKKVWFPNAQSYKNIGNKILYRGFNPIKLLLLRIRMAKNKDLVYLEKLCEELIKVGFNKESDQLKGKYKVKASTAPKLVNVILLQALDSQEG